MFNTILQKPTATPVVIYAPPDPNVINIIMGLGILIVLIVSIGIWINHSKLIQ